MFGKFGPVIHESLSNDPRNTFDKISKGIDLQMSTKFPMSFANHP